ncbi:Phosphopantetheine attachment site domain protein [Pseudomonas syringae pv. delphinii]|uniref:Phosphopantetheine attachment site domain protein n=1 Tax=Pseudomonas syringae pv. delphinii TaxID=192088 RepID=A0A0P9PWF9_9PSED|nr:acyl carrier protein [Pseudomonas syringae group genomosp. 3]KPX16200.1 Phosphopantetheine attachment site domain protein [Pseudomonas syringae pv. delphinii]RMP08837.1 Phosphopantetheine attachment site domain protein [Pseudomonas syringae pv. delphinii]RMP22481.1 Phosphopantetheine attachment site domain protein [Pseudomonas syringae pv. delphinii]RMQ28503.1 Phosphopantetheine attachment site domain protein [Pseudomonas syringae pv. delphinii]
MKITKEQLEKIWTDILELDSIDPDKSVFDLGMDSIKALDISDEIFSRTQIRLEWKDFNVTTTLNETLAMLNTPA